MKMNQALLVDMIQISLTITGLSHLLQCEISRDVSKLFVADTVAHTVLTAHTVAHSRTIGSW
jgi:hypothetical protein